MKLSVIIPVFNAADTLERCVKSVALQGIKDMEILLIDDGSTDAECVSLCKQMTLSTAQTQVIHQRHAGLSAARNTGLDAATGTFITFVDADDYLELGTYERILPLFTSHKDLDLVEFSYIEKEGHASLQRERLLQDKVYTTFEEYWLGAQAYQHCYMCNKIFRRALFKEVRFPTGQNFEDTYVLPRLTKQCRALMTTSIGLYHYCWNAHGITASASAADYANLLTTHLNILKDISDPVYYESILNIQLDTYEKGDRRLRLPLIPYHGTAKLYLLHLIGLKTLCKLNLFYHKLRSILK